MSPELHTRIWMSNKRNASMIIGISIGQETCLILGQVLLRNSRTGRPVDGPPSSQSCVPMSVECKDKDEDADADENVDADQNKNGETRG